MSWEDCSLCTNKYFCADLSCFIRNVTNISIHISIFMKFNCLPIVSFAFVIFVFGYSISHKTLLLCHVLGKCFYMFRCNPIMTIYRVLFQKFPVVWTSFLWICLWKFNSVVRMFYRWQHENLFISLGTHIQKKKKTFGNYLIWSHWYSKLITEHMIDMMWIQYSYHLIRPHPISIQYLGLLTLLVMV